MIYNHDKLKEDILIEKPCMGCGARMYLTVYQKGKQYCCGKCQYCKK